MPVKRIIDLSLFCFHMKDFRELGVPGSEITIADGQDWGRIGDRRIMRF